jgi:hypothetical protein
MRRVLYAFEERLERGTASVNLEGRMIDIATTERCRKVLRRAAAIEKMERRKSEALMDPNSLEERIRSSIEAVSSS